MRNKLSTSVVLASMLALMFVSANAGQGRGGGSGDRDQQMDRDHSYDRDQDRTRDYASGESTDRDQDRDRSYDHDQDRTRDYAAGESVDRDQDRDQLRGHDQDRTQDYASGESMDRDQDRDQLRGHDQDQARDRLHTGDPANLRDVDIYGSALMSEEELKQYRKQLETMGTAQERESFQARHEERMQVRAQEQGKDLVPPGQGPIYGGELMTVQERNQYREQLRHLDSDKERQKFQAQHREQMELRAKALKLDIEEAE